MRKNRTTFPEVPGRGAAAFALLLALAGCAGEAPTSYDLHASAVARLSMRGSLAVDRPTAEAPLDSDLIVIRAPQNQLASLGGAQWADRLGPLLRSRLQLAFENAGLLRNLRRPGEPADLRLVLDIRRFDIDAGAREARVEIAAQLVSERGGVVAAKIFAASEPLGEIAGAEPALALDRAFGRLQPQLVAWTVGAR
jgi:cholesterol transport system auxiliary component